MEVLSISLGRNILKPGSRDRERMQLYAKELEAYHIIVLTRRVHGFMEEVHEGNLHVYPTHSRTRLHMLWDAFWIGRRIARMKREQPLIISAQDPLAIGWLSWLLVCASDARLHIQVHGDYFSPQWVGHSLVRRFERFWALRLLTCAPAIRVVSARIAQSLIARNISRERITVLPIRPELEAFLAMGHMFRDEPPLTLLYIGRLAPEKDIPRIVRAFACIRAEYPNIHLRIVGEGSEKGKIESCIRVTGVEQHVSLAPWTEDVPREMNRADVLLVASEHEAYGLVLVEAMAVGLPIVTTDVGCVGEVFKDGVHGVVVRSAGDAAYAETLRTLLADADMRRACGRRAKETAQTLSETVTSSAYVRAWVTSLS
jgi:glycosyltransferase involved in cell wall biosynthesis